MRNFIKDNIDNVKGSRRPASLIERGSDSKSPPKKSNQPNSQIHPQPNINRKVQRLEQQVSRLHQEQNNSLILEQLSEIKDDIRMIKSHIYQMSNKGHSRGDHLAPTVRFVGKQKTNSSNYDEEETITSMNNIRLKSQSENDQHARNHSGGHNQSHQGHYSHQSHTHSKRVFRIEEIISQKTKRASSSYNKNGISLKSLHLMLKQYKLEGPDFGTIFYGYSKRNSQPVAIKYSEQTLTHVLEVYDRLWKNIAKAKWPCINRIYDFKSDDLNLMVMERNKNSIAGLPYETVLIDILKIIEFIHECGFLYRNIEPQHFMLNEEEQMVVLDFKRARRYVDIKGHPMEVVENSFTGSPFASNNQVRGLPEGRKDDLQSLGYFALLLFEMELPWAGMNKEHTIKIRSSLTLQQLFHQNAKWIQYMAVVMKTSRNERPDYKRLTDILSS